MNDIKIKEWNLEQFKNSREEWNRLLDRSDSDPLFLSWEWQYTWWEVFSRSENMQLKIYAAYKQDTLVGIAPLYLTKAQSKKFIFTNRLQFIGNIWRGKATMRTELLDFVTDKNLAEESNKALISYISSQKDWNEIILTDLKTTSITYRIIQDKKTLCKCFYRVAENFESYYVNTKTDFDSYVKSLGKNTRLRIYNRRKVLKETGSLKFSRSENSNIDKQFNLLNQFHIDRWKKPVFENDRLNFNKKVANLMAEKGALNFSTIYIDEKPISLQYNYILKNHEYNIQAGIVENYHKKLALGYLHFGYEIQHACENGIHTYDFLAGGGKNEDYKSRLTGNAIKLVDLQVIRSKPIALIYKAYDTFCSKGN